jgi:hypothetical protein
MGNRLLRIPDAVLSLTVLLLYSDLLSSRQAQHRDPVRHRSPPLHARCRPHNRHLRAARWEVRLLVRLTPFLRSHAH